MKKRYIKPWSRLMDLEAESMMCGSDDVHSDKGISYGGVDGGGSLNPDARDAIRDETISSPNVWEEW